MTQVIRAYVVKSFPLKKRSFFKATNNWMINTSMKLFTTKQTRNYQLHG